MSASGDSSSVSSRRLTSAFTFPGNFLACEIDPRSCNVTVSGWALRMVRRAPWTFASSAATLTARLAWFEPSVATRIFLNIGFSMKIGNGGHPLSRVADRVSTRHLRENGGFLVGVFVLLNLALGKSFIQDLQRRIARVAPAIYHPRPVRMPRKTTGTPH